MIIDHIGVAVSDYDKSKWAQVRAFYEAAIAVGGKGNGPPWLPGALSPELLWSLLDILPRLKARDSYGALQVA